MFSAFYSYGLILDNAIAIAAKKERLKICCKKNIRPLGNDKKQYLVRVNFDTTHIKISTSLIEITPENAKNIAEEYFWVGNTPDTNNRYLTTNKYSSYLKTTGNPMFVLESSKKINKQKIVDTIKDIRQHFYLKEYLDLTRLDSYERFIEYIKSNYSDAVLEYKKTRQKSKRKDIIKKLSKMLVIFSQKDLETLIRSISDADKFAETFTATLQSLSKKDSTKIKELFCRLIKIEKDQIALITPLINGEPMVKMHEYVEYLHSEFFLRDVGKNTEQFVCAFCSEIKDGTDASYFKGTKIKFFNTDKEIFASNVNKKRFNYNMSICRDCFRRLQLGMHYCLKNMRSKWADNDLLIIPNIYPIENINGSELLNEIIEASQNVNQQLYDYSLDEFRKFEKNLEVFLETKDTLLTFNYIFFDTDQGGRPNKISALITEIPPTRLKQIYEAQVKLYQKECIKPRKPVTLKTIFLALPIKTKKSREKKKRRDKFVLQLYDAILNEKRINLTELIEMFLSSIKIIHFKTFGYHINPNKTDISMKLLEMNEIITFLELINVLPKQKPFEATAMYQTTFNQISLPLREAIESYWDGKSVYQQNETRALFLLGMLIAEVASAQYSSLHSEPILKKINFNGMRKEKIISLVTDVAGKLHNYKKFNNQTKTILLLVNHLIETSADRWTLNSSENVFYILSGYGFMKSYLKEQRMKKQTESTDAEKQVEEFDGEMAHDE